MASNFNLSSIRQKLCNLGENFEKTFSIFCCKNRRSKIISQHKVTQILVYRKVRDPIARSGPDDHRSCSSSELANRMERWAGKVAVVTGASVGIGASIARELVRNGLMVAGLARRVEKIEEIAASLEGSAGKLYAVECDISQEESVLAAFSWIRENLGTVDVLVNNAGITKDSSLIGGTLEDWRAVFDVNVLGLCLCTREAVRMMKENDRDAVVIHISSLAAERVPAIPGFSVYPATKRAVAGLAQTLRHELMGTQIRVTSINPGLVDTELLATNSMFTKELLGSLPILQPEDIAAAVVYTLSTPAHVQVQDIVLRPLGETW